MMEICLIYLADKKNEEEEVETKCLLNYKEFVQS